MMQRDNEMHEEYLDHFELKEGESRYSQPYLPDMESETDMFLVYSKEGKPVAIVGDGKNGL